MLLFLRIAARNLITHRTRTLIIGGAIASVTMLLVLMLALTAGINRTILRNSIALASGHVNIAGFYKLSQTSANPVVTNYRPLLKLARENVPEAKLFYTRLKAFGKIISDSNSVTAPMWGIDVANEKEILGDLKTVEGSIEDVANPGNMAIFASHAKKLKVKVGDMVTISLPTNRNVYNTKDVRIAAILADMGLMSAFTTFMNAEDTRELYQLPAKATGQIMIKLKNPEDVPVVEERLRKLIKESGRELMAKESQPYWMKFERVAGESWTGQRIDVTTWQDETAFTSWVLSLLGALTFIFTGTLLTIVVLGVINTLWMAIRERTSEVGTLRAIGLQRRQVLQMFLLESALLSVGGILVGMLLGVFIAGLLNLAGIEVTSEAFQMFLMSNHVELAIVPGSLVMTFVVISFFLITGSLIPSYRASKLKPVTAINFVN